MPAQTPSLPVRHSLLLLALGLLAGSGPGRAGEVAVQRGRDAGYHDTVLVHAGDPFWRRQSGQRPLTAHLEISLGEVTAPSGLPDDRLWHVGLTPTLRYELAAGTGVEYGFGALLFSGTRLGDKSISTALQFSNTLGIYHQFADSPWSLGLRYSHYSNGDLKRPNPGQDYLMLRLGYRLD